MTGKSVLKTIVYPENISNNSFKILPDVVLPDGKYAVRMQIEGVTHTVKMIVE
ncbi:MAG: hypothetical protein ACOVLD_05935 [Bacteroidia bacterium]